MRKLTRPIASVECLPLDGADRCGNPKESWFALRVQSRHEKIVAAAIEHRGYEGFLPLWRSRHKWSDRFREVDLPLFPGYVFCRFDPWKRVPLLSVPGLVHIVGIGKAPCPVDETEIAALRAVVSSGLYAQPWPFLKSGQMVLIQDGPLRTIQGVLTEIKGSHQLVVSVTLLQRSVAVCVERQWVRPLEHSASQPRLS